MFVTKTAKKDTVFKVETHFWVKPSVVASYNNGNCEQFSFYQ